MNNTFSLFHPVDFPAFFPMKGVAIERLSARQVRDTLDEVRAELLQLRDAGKSTG